MHRVLAVHPDADVLDLMASTLDENYPDLILVPVRNAAHAADQHLVRVEVIALHAAAGPRAHREIIPAQPQGRGQLAAHLPHVLSVEAI